MTHSAGIEFLVILLAFFISPVAIFIVEGPTPAFWINLILYLLTYFLGVIHALFVIGSAKSGRRDAEICKNSGGRNGRYSVDSVIVYPIPVQQQTIDSTSTQTPMDTSTQTPNTTPIATQTPIKT